MQTQTQTTMYTIRDGAKDLGAFVSLNLEWVIYPAAIILGLSLGAFLALL